jgi:tetratricopeptide (TPR) repeat protein
MWDNKVNRQSLYMVILYMVIIVTSIWAGFLTPRAECLTLDSCLLTNIVGSEVVNTSGEDRNLDQMQSNTRNSEFVLGEEMFRSGHLKEARMAFENIVKLDSRNPQAQYFLGLIEYEEGNIEKSKARFQIAYDCLDLQSGTELPKIDMKQAELQFPDDYKARIYYKDGWYVRPKNPSDISKTILSLEEGSSYKIELKPEHKSSWRNRGIIGLVVLLSFFLVR